MMDTPAESEAPGASEATSSWPVKISALIDDSQIVKTATAITCLLILLTGPREWYVAVPTSTLAAAALLFPALRASRSLWLFMATAVGASALFNWEETDNHKYLLAYWCIAIALSIGERDPRAY